LTGLNSVRGLEQDLARPICRMLHEGKIELALEEMEKAK
jgi:hypothetical protein